MKKIIMICVDAQNDFFGGGLLPVSNADSIKENIKKVIIFARERNIPIVYTQDNHSEIDKEMITVGGPFPIHAISGTVGQENITEATIKKNEKIFTKQTYDVFTNSEIKDWLTDNKITECYIFGLVGNICVEAAAIGLRNLGIDVYIFENVVVWMDMEKGIFCEDNDNKEKSVDRLRKIGCHFVKCGL
jgi:nicotinamidase-related amidase